MSHSVSPCNVMRSIRYCFLYIFLYQECTDGFSLTSQDRAVQKLLVDVQVQFYKTASHELYFQYQ